MRLSFSLLLFALAACGPRINPAMQAATDRLLTSYQGGATEGRPSSYDPMPWAVGQWVAFKVTEEGRPPSVSVMKIVGREGNGWWLEFETQDYYNRSVMKVLYARQPKGPDDAVDALQRVVMKSNDGPVQELDFAGNPFAAMMKKSMTNTSFAAPAVSKESTEDVTVAAGSFKGAAAFDTTVTVGPVRRSFKGWFHPAVPLNGGVRSVSEDGKVVSELLGCGTSGARSALQR
jgi:hypothetical protein